MCVSAYKYTNISALRVVCVAHLKQLITSYSKMKFSVVAIVFQIILIILFATLVKYDPTQSGAYNKTNPAHDSTDNKIKLYPSK